METGISFRQGELDIAASYFWSDSDLGSRILVVDGVGQITRQKTEIEGLEISANYHFDSGVSTGLAYVNNSTYFTGRGRAVALGWEKAF